VIQHQGMKSVAVGIPVTIMVAMKMNEEIMPAFRRLETAA
jgi:hypothetical protein